ncbi:PIN domain nuclease, a component of toxin-antitoxin system (PIN domain) [Methylobacterium sp. ap11]|uniref:type II toxin-antitoxin system VapC family toxin n=1 Tax=Methylobacterium sp. ap11 TaxID=1761799 RepID=UPI0008BBA242|nr:type II toxin-antitoxin system VapC family toxin [Methylobacterium sp. ap11]SEP05674.1 PIN domain nuclease, a component of toxin-antitoxin system (PIN domain) [Methylobacterium sp. ap11]
MSAFVLDASALLALLLDEPGADRVKAVLDGAAMGAVNWAEVVSHYAKLGAARTDIEAMLRPLPIRVVPADRDLSVSAGMLRPITLPLGLSLGDRYCLALAKREAATALTAERRWCDIAAAAAVEVESIR